MRRKMLIDGTLRGGGWAGMEATAQRKIRLLRGGGLGGNGERC